MEVRQAAAVALSGYAKHKNEVLPILVRKFSRAKKERDLHILAGAICELEPSSPVVRKFVKGCFGAYAKARDGYYNPSWLLSFLSAHKEQGVFATKDLLNAADRRVKQGSYPGEIAVTLIKVAPNDPRVVKFYQSWSKKGPQELRVHYDSIAKQLLAIKNKNGGR